MFNSTQATVSTYEEEGLPAWKLAKRCCPRCSLGRTSSQRCRCVCARHSRAVSAAIGRFDRTPHHTGAAEPATAAAPAAPDGPAPAERRSGQKRKASSSPDVRLELLARARYCALHACADAHGRATDCAAGPPAAAAAASAASAAPIEPSTSAAQQPASPVRPLSACHCTRPSHAHAHARPAFDPATAAVRRCRIG